MQLLASERRRFLLGPDLISASLNTLRDNYSIWNAQSWAQYGEEWTLDVSKFRGLDPNQWKADLLATMLKPYVKSNSVIVEIGPGGGRWTEQLLPFSDKLYLIDISEKALEVCRQRFGYENRVRFIQVCDQGDSFIKREEIDDQSIDFIWSYDVFVHINPNDINKYLRDFARVMKSHSMGVIHHAGSYKASLDRLHYFRSNIDARFFNHLLKTHDFQVITQNSEMPHFPGDVITVFKKK